MERCAFCPELGVATTATTTSTEAFPFLCTQLGVNVSPSFTSTGSSFGGRNGGGGGGGPSALCSSCHSLWEEVSVLYSNMQGLVNLMARRVTQFKKNINEGNNKEGPGEDGKRGRKRNLPPPDDESLLSWWYPSAKKNSEGNQVGVDVEFVESDPFSVGYDTEIKAESREYLSEAEFDVDVVGETQGGEDQEMEVEEYKIFSHGRESDDAEGQYEDDNRDDPSYDPLQLTKSSPSKDETAAKKKRGHPIKKGLTKPDRALVKASKSPRTATYLVDLPFILKGVYYKLANVDSNNGKVVAICLECQKQGKFQSISGNVKTTSNFIKHLKRCHIVMYYKFEESRRKDRMSKGNFSILPLEMPNLSQSVETETIGHGLYDS